MQKKTLPITVSAVLLFVLAWFQPPDGPPLGSATAEQIRAYVAASDIALRLGAASYLLAAVLVVIFAGALAERVRAALPGSSLAATAYGGGLLVAVTMFLSAVTVGLLPLLPGLIGTDLAAVDDAVLRGWYAFGGVNHFAGDLMMGPIALTVGAFSLAALRARLLPRWLGWAGVVVAASATVGTAGILSGSAVLYPFWFGGIFGWLLWVLATGVALAVRGRRAPDQAAVRETRQTA